MGDFLRSLVSFHAVCEESGLPLYVSLDKIPHFRRCFDLKEAPFPCNDLPTEIHIGGHDGTALIHRIVRKCNAEKTSAVFLCCNSGLLHDPSLLLKHLPTFPSILRPSTEVMSLIQTLYERHGLTAGNYYSVHIRCGDVFMRQECGGVGNASSDKRTDLNTERLLYYDRLIQNCVTRHGFDRSKPIVIHSDCAEFKHGLCALNPSCYVVLDTEIQHVANQYGKNTLDSFLSTVAEFYILTRSCGVVMPIYSGFSHIAAFLGQVPLVCSATPTEAWHGEMLASFPPGDRLDC